MICKLLQRQWFRSLPKLMGTFTITAQVRFSPSQAWGGKGGSNSTRVLTGAPVPWRQAVHLHPAQAILFLLSHQPHHFQSRVPLVGRNLEASRIRVSVPGSLPGAGGQGWLPEMLPLGSGPALWQQLWRSAAPACHPQESIPSVKRPRAGQNFPKLPCRWAAGVQRSQHLERKRASFSTLNFQSYSCSHASSALHPALRSALQMTGL